MLSRYSKHSNHHCRDGRLCLLWTEVLTELNNKTKQTEEDLPHVSDNLLMLSVWMSSPLRCTWHRHGCRLHLQTPVRLRSPRCTVLGTRDKILRSLRTWCPYDGEVETELDVATHAYQTSAAHKRAVSGSRLAVDLADPRVRAGRQPRHTGRSYSRSRSPTSSRLGCICRAASRSLPAVCHPAATGGGRDSGLAHRRRGAVSIRLLSGSSRVREGTWTDPGRSLRGRQAPTPAGYSCARIQTCVRN